MRKAVVVWGAVVLLVIAGLAGATAWYMLGLPGHSYSGEPPPTTAPEHDLATRLQRHVTAIASEPHNIAHPDALEAAAAYIEAELMALGYTPQAQVFEADGQAVRNIEVVREPPGSSADTPSLVIGAHYDSFGTAPGANDNGTGTAAVIELARLLKDVPLNDKRLRLVLFTNEEPPYDRTPDMGSWRYAQMLKERGETVAGMISLETIGCFSDEPGSQKYPPPFGLFFPTKANFIAFVAMPGSRSFLHEVVGPFRRHAAIPTIGGTAPDRFDGVGWSDHWSFSKFEYPAIMITDTALFRYRHYHKPTDTPDKVDYDKLARITLGLDKTIRELVTK
jgi:Peptidase family M28